MFFLPLFIGILAGVILTIVATLLNKSEVSKLFIRIYSLGTMILGVLIGLYGYLIVRGFEGFAYMQLGFPIVIFSVVIYLLSFKQTQAV